MKKILALLAVATLGILLFNRGTIATTFVSKANNQNQQSVQEFSAQDYLRANEVYNAESVIPPQCYTRTDQVNNPCYVCHQNYDRLAQRPNIMNDGDLQGSYAFSELGENNHWRNLFVDRQVSIAELDDATIDQYVVEDNYEPFIAALKAQGFKGDIPALKNLAYPEKAFGEYGLAKDGSHWVAFNYKPFPSTFWPTNGSTGDVMIRLPTAFREHQGKYQFDTYFANLSLMEMAIKDLAQISVPPISEKKIGTDLDGDGQLSDRVELIIRQSHYVGDAKRVALATMLYPQGTEILHTVRYIGIDSAGQIYNAPRMKEVRYMRKHVFKSPGNLASSYYSEKKEKAFEKLPQTVFHGDRGIANGFGWTINGFIEDESGKLRQQNHQELSFCNGCHKSIGTTIDQTFSFPRKLDGLAGWGYIDLKKLKDAPNLNEVEGEYLTYLQRVGGGDEYRQNTEMLNLWFDEQGRVKAEKIATLDSIYPLITPSPTRARQLNKAYRRIVEEQSYIFGRDPSYVPSQNVHRQVDESQAPLLPENQFTWDMRLQWREAAR